eukprot:m.209994 g.209994  ORF g.209994 m.209994 type:complete len:110 (-) comp53955_c0_seq8:139-468(-)
MAVCSAIKVVVARPRPAHNRVVGDMFATISPTIDAYGFPSGHSTKSAVIASFLAYTYTHPAVSPLVLLWAMVALSRVLLGRHHLLDVVFGLLSGYCVYAFMFFLHVRLG